jgi:hypothetical protein
MHALVSWALFTVIVAVAGLAIADSLAKVRLAHARLMREGEVLRAGLAGQTGAGTVRMRPAPHGITGERRPVPVAVRRLPLRQACAAA